MFTILGGILAFALVVAVIIAAVISFNWLKSKVKEILTRLRGGKAVVVDLGGMIKNQKNRISADDFFKLDEKEKENTKQTLQQLEKLRDKGCTHLLASLKDNDEVVDVETFKDTSSTEDLQVKNLINRTGEGMLVIES